MTEPDAAGIDTAGTAEPILNVEHLLDASEPQATPWLAFLPMLGLGCLAGAVAVAAFAGPEIGVPVSLVLLGLSIASTVYLARLAGAARDERRSVKRCEELVRLREWSQAAGRLRDLLSKPMRLWVSRRQALSLLVRVLGRYETYDEAAEVARELSEDARSDPSTRFNARCGLAMLQLRTGRLGEANDTLDQLRGEVRRVQGSLARGRRMMEEMEDEDTDTPPRPEPEPDLPAEALMDADGDPGPPAEVSKADDFEPAPLILAELYRDIQTNHNAEAVEMFEVKRELLRDQLGLRVGDAYALAAIAARKIGRKDDARQWWLDATALSTVAEFSRRYPEVKDVEDLPATAPLSS
jgi:hypothetical protein